MVFGAGAAGSSWSERERSSKRFSLDMERGRVLKPLEGLNEPDRGSAGCMEAIWVGRMCRVKGRSAGL